MSRTLQTRLLGYFSLSIIISLASLLLVLLNTLRLQDMADRRFRKEQELQEVQQYIRLIQPSLREYLASWSSDSLGTLLLNMEKLKDLLPDERPVYADERDLLERRLYFLIDSYLEEVNLGIEEKRARRVDAYTARYERVQGRYTYILTSIDELSLLGLRVQLGEYRNFLGLFRRIQLYSLLQILIATVFAYSLLLRSIALVTSPLFRLSEMAEKLSAKEYDIPDLHLSSSREMDQLAEAFNLMKRGIKEHINEIQSQKEMEQQIMNERLRNLKMEQLLKRMELYTMQAQMNPHFLFNTINTGVQLAVLEEADKTAEFMEKLSRLFRNNTRDKDFFVPLRYEIEGLETYFDILRIRFPKSLTLDLTVDRSLLDRYICPSMIIQPLVENSVLHAFGQSAGRGSITVFVGFDDPVLIISVKDNGSGIPEDIRRALLVPHTHDYQLSSKVMGLENVIQRCYFFYPDQDDVIGIQSEPGVGTEVIIRIHTEVEPCIEL